MHPRKTAMRPKKRQPEMERSTLLFKTAIFKIQKEIGSEKEYFLGKIS